MQQLGLHGVFGYFNEVWDESLASWKINIVFLCIYLASLTSADASLGADSAYQKYEWQSDPSASYYNGVIISNGHKIRFRTSGEWVILPSGQDVKITPHRSSGKTSEPIHTVSKPVLVLTDETMQEDALIEQPEASKEKEEYKEQEDTSYYDQYLEDESQEQEHQVQKLEPEAELLPARSSKYKNLYRDVDLVFGFGRESLNLKGGISVLENQANIGITELNAGVCLGHESDCDQYYQIHIKAHKFTSQYQEDSNTQKDISLLLTDVQLRGSKQWNMAQSAVKIGLGMGSVRLPTLVVTDPVVGTAEIDGRQTGVLQATIGFQYDINEQQSLLLQWHQGLLALNYFKSYQSYEVSIGWQYLFYENFYSKLGILSRKTNTTYKVDCDDALGGCEQGSLDDRIASFHYGVGYRFGSSD